jgi:polyhydroxybutyrate depolymerase
MTRVYTLHVPPGLDKSRPVPLVLVFHGGGGTSAFAERDTGFSAVADRERFLVAYPQGYRKSWNDGRNVADIAAQKDKVDDIAFIAALLDDVAVDYKVDGNRVFATGISNGGFFSHYLAVNLSSRIAAIAPVSGGLPESLRERFHPENPVSVLILHGTADPLVPYGGGDVSLFGKKRGRLLPTEEAAGKWADRNGCRGELVEGSVINADPRDGCQVRPFAYSGCREGTGVSLYRIENGGHTWPDGLQYLPKRMVGPVCRDIHGADVIWEFFKNHPRTR